MFTGIISEKGEVASAVTTDTGVMFTITAPATVVGAAIGDSIAVNGVCLTATSIDGDSFRCMAVGETLERTSLSGLVAGDPVNLERPMPADGRFDGHIVQGHVDGIGTILAVAGEGDARRIRIGVATTLSPYMVEKGSVTVDGTSLTITATSDPQSTETWIEVVLIPHTLENTVFGTREAGDKVNVEVDVIAKYVERMTESKR